MLACEARALGRRLLRGAAVSGVPPDRAGRRAGGRTAHADRRVARAPDAVVQLLTLLIADTGRVDDAAALLRSLTAPDALPQDQLLLASWAILGESAVVLGDRSCAGELAVRLAPFARRGARPRGSRSAGARRPGTWPGCAGWQATDRRPAARRHLHRAASPLGRGGVGELRWPASPLHPVAS